MSISNIQIDIIIEDYGIYATRYWTHIPRKGDYIKLEGDKEGWYLIQEVDWQGKEYPIVVLIVDLVVPNDHMQRLVKSTNTGG